MNEQNGSKWYERAGESPEVVCSTRVRLARNLRGVPFPDRAGPEDKARVIELAWGSSAGRRRCPSASGTWSARTLSPTAGARRCS